MPGPLDFLMQAPSEDDVKRASETATVAPSQPESGTGLGLDFLYKPVEKRSAAEIVQRGETAGRDWKDTASELKKAGYAAPEEIGTQYEQRRALRTEKEKQGQGVSTLEQAARHLIPFGSAVLNNRRESANYEATQRFQQGKATPEDIQTLATHQRRAAADQSINSSDVGQLLSIPLAAPAILGETMAGGKFLSMGGKALGIGKVAAPPLLAAANPSTARVAMNFAGKQALLTPLVPSLYVEKANQLNEKEGRNPNDIRGFAPAIGLGYAQMLVLGSLQKFGNTGSFADQVVQKGAIGVGEQAIADTGVSAVDEFLPKAYQTGTRYGVIGNMARGEVGEGLKQATTQMLTFSYFAALHGHTPDRTKESYRKALAAQFEAGLPPDTAAQAVDAPRKIVSDALERNPDLTRAEAREAIDEVNKKLPRPMSGENIAYGYAVADALPKQARGERNIKPGSLLERKAGAEDAPTPSETKGEHWDGTGRVEAPVEVKAPETAPEAPPVDPIDAMHPEDRADLAKSLGIKEKGLRDPKIVEAVREMAKAAIADRAAKEKPAVPAEAPSPPAPAPAEVPAASAGEENTPLRGGEAKPVGDALLHVPDYKTPGSNLSAARKLLLGAFAGKWFSKGHAQNEGYFTDGKFQVEFNGDRLGGEPQGDFVERRAKEVGVGSQTAMYLHPALSTIRYRGKADGAEFKEMESLVKDVNDERAKAGLDPVKLEAADRRSQATEDHPGRRAGEPNAVAPEPAPEAAPAVDRFAKARARSSDPLAKTAAPVSRPEPRPDPDAVTAPEARQDKKLEAARFEDIPKVFRDRADKAIAEMARLGYKPDGLRETVVAAFVLGKAAGVEALTEHWEARTQEPTEKLRRVAEIKEQQAKEELDAAVAKETGNVGGGVDSDAARARVLASYEPGGWRTVRDAADRERWAAVQRDIGIGVRGADAIANGRNPAEAPQSQKPGRKKGSNLTPAGKVKNIADVAEPDAKVVLEDALYNYANKGAYELASAIGRGAESSYNSSGAGHVQREVSPAVVRAATRAVRSLGGVEHGPAVGEQAEYNPHYYQPPPGAETWSFKDELRVVRRPLVIGDAVAMRGILAKPKAAREQAATEGQTLAQYIRGYGGIDASSLSPAERAEWRESGLHMVFQNERMGKGANAIDALAEHLIEEGYLQSDPKHNPTDVLLEALKKGKVVDESHTSAEADLREHWRQEEEAARDRGDTETWKPSEEEIPFATEPGKEVLGGAHPSETKAGKPGAFDIIAQQNKLFDVRNYVEKSVPYNKAALAVALREQEATVTSKIAAGDPLVNLEEHAHHIQKALGLPESPDSLPLVVARGAQAFYQPDGKGVPTRMGMIEGFAKWLRLRSTDGLTGLSREQEVASQYYEKWAAEKGLTKTFDQIRDLYRAYQGRPAAEQAAANVSATGKPVEADRTAAEVATSVSQKAEGLIVNDLSVLQRMTRAAKALGHHFGIGEDPYTVFSQLMFADPARAGEFERDGVHTIVDGRKVVIGESLAKIVEGGKPEWLKPDVNGGASKAGTFAVARHILGEEARGRTGLVSEVQLEQYRRAMSEFQQDKPFAEWAEQFAKKLTVAFNASRKALAGKDVHFLSEKEVAEWEAKYPDYIPTDRVLQDAGWKSSAGSRGESPRKITGERSGSGEQIVDPLISYKNRLRVTSAVMGEQLKRIAVEKVLKLPGMGGWGIAGEATLTDLGKIRAETLEQFGFKGDQLREILKSMGAERAEEYFTSRPWPTDGTKPTWGLKNAGGKLVNYRIGDKGLYDLITGQQVEANALASWLKATASFLPVKFMTQAVKFGATSASLGFQFRNVPRDIYTFWSNTIDRTKANPRDLGDAYKRAFAFAWHQLTGHFGGAASQDALFKKFADHRGDDLRQFDFDKNEPASAYGPDRGKAVQTAHTVWGVLKDTLRLAGSGELAPRFLEWKTRLEQTTGKSEAQLTAELTAAEKAAAEGKPVPDPIPFHLALDAMNHAAEVTTPFNRLGTLTREVNKITPFFGPAIAGLSKQVRNWKDNPKGAAFALSGLLAARLLHWAMFSDEDWYKELNSNDRYNNFVVPTPAGLRRFPAPRGLEVAGGGFLTTVLDAAAKKNPDLKGYLRETLGAVAPPLPVPPAAKVGYEIASNQNWMGSPIVPKREEGTSAGEKFLEHQAPYAADQLTGGLLNERKIPKEAKDLIPYSEVRNARRSVDEFYERLKELEAGHQDARQQGIRYENEVEYKRLEAAGHKLTEMSRAVRGERLVNGRVVKGEEPPEDKKQELRKRQVELARAALSRN